MGDRKRLILALMLGLIALSVAQAATGRSRVVPASDVLAKIKANQSGEFDNCTIVGDLNLSTLKIEGVAHFNSTTFLNSVIFESATFSDAAYFRGSNFKGVFADFSNSNFNGEANFRSSTFDGPVGFEYTHFNGAYATFVNSEFNGSADFKNSEFNGSAYFGFISDTTFKPIGSQFNGRADFSNSKFNGISAYFWSSNFNGDADFSNSNFNEDADFRDSSFNGYINFQSSNFNGGADFGYSNFNEEADFRDSSFNGGAYFSNSNFNGRYVDFSNSKFNREATFDSSKFNREADFRDSSFNEDAYFSNSNFNGTASFVNSKFNRTAFFTTSTFNKGANFDDVKFNNITKFDDSQFVGDARFEKANFNKTLFLTRTRYNKLYIRWYNITDGLSYDDTAYISLLKNFKDLGYFEDYDSCYFQYRKEHRGQPWPLVSGIDQLIRKGIDVFLEWFYGYGTKPLNALYFSIAIIIAFGGFWRAIGLGGPDDVTGKDDESWEKPEGFFDVLSFSTTVFLSGTKLFIDPPDIPKINGRSKSTVKKAFIVERILGALFSILFFLAISGTVVR